MGLFFYYQVRKMAEPTKEEIIRLFKQRDRFRSVLSEDGFFRATLVKSSNTSLQAQKSHKLDTVSAYLLSRYLTASVLFASTLKGQERVIIEAEGNGPIARIYAESSQIGEVRGYIAQSLDKNLEDIEHFDEAIGIGLLKVSRVLYNEPEPITGIVPLETGDIAKDLAYYYVQSEQIPTAILIDTKMDNNGLVAVAGGLIVQAMPGASEEAMEEISEKLSSLEPLTSFLESEDRPIDILEEILPFSFSETKTSPVDFFCRCSKDRFIDKLSTLSVKDLKEMKAEGQNELVCQFCGTQYILEDSDFQLLIDNATAKSN
ncbi:MAG: Hsp33 family molecular chaperone HslO [Candidatus Kapaibacteriales bacterium]